MKLKATITLSGESDSENVRIQFKFSPGLPGESNPDYENHPWFNSGTGYFISKLMIFLKQELKQNSDDEAEDD